MCFFHNLMHMGKKTETKERGVEKFLCRYYIIVDWFYSFKENLHESFFCGRGYRFLIRIRDLWGTILLRSD